MKLACAHWLQGEIDAVRPAGGDPGERESAFEEWLADLRNAASVAKAH